MQNNGKGKDNISLTLDVEFIELLDKFCAQTYQSRSAVLQRAVRREILAARVDDRESLETIRKLLGHSRVSTTDLYIRNIKHDKSLDATEALSKIDFRSKFENLP